MKEGGKIIKKYIFILLGVLLIYNSTVMVMAESETTDTSDQVVAESVSESYDYDEDNKSNNEQSYASEDDSESLDASPDKVESIEERETEAEAIEDEKSRAETILDKKNEKNDPESDTGHVPDSISDDNDGTVVEHDLVEAEEAKPSPILAQPTDFLVYQASIDSVRMTWTEVEGADYYELFREENESGSWIKIKNVFDGFGSNLNLESGIQYSYKIRAVTVDNEIKEYGLFSEEASVVISKKIPSNLVVNRSTLTTVSLRWDPVENAAKYEVYRKKGDDGSWGKVKTVYGTTTSNLNLESGFTYHYKVRSYIETSIGGFLGDFSDVDSVTMSDTKPGNLEVGQVSLTSVRIKWDEVEDCDHYELYRKDNDEESWIKIKNIYGTVGSNLNLTTGNTYSYKIRSIFSSNNSFSGVFSDVATIRIEEKLSAPSMMTVQQVGTNRVYLAWSSVEGAEKYYLYRSDNGGKWVRAKTVNETNTNNFALIEGVSYRYKVTAACNEGFTEFESAASDTVSFLLGSSFETVSDLKARYQTNTKVNLSWTDNSSTSSETVGYKLYRRVNDGGWAWIKNSSTTTTNNLNLESGNIYSYYVRVYGESEYGIYYSLPSNVVVYWNETVKGLSITNSELSWESIDAAEEYKIYADGNQIATEKSNTYTLSDDYIGSTISVSAVRTFENREVESHISEGVLYQNNNQTKFRALVIGETAYTTKLNGPDNDMHFMNAMLSGLTNRYDVCAQQNATLNEIVDLVDVAFDGATDEDVSLFYYSGHGVTGAGEYYSGALQTVDYQYLTTADLAELLSHVPGRIVVILDSCGSGAAISDGKDSITSVQSLQNNRKETMDKEPDKELSEFDPEKFNNGVINAFSSYDSVLNNSGASSETGGLLRSGELKQTKFFVITGSSYEENSLTTMINGVWGGVLTRGIANGTGTSYPDGNYSGSMPADINDDSGLSFLELADFCKEYAGDKQNVLSYSASPNYMIIRR